MNFMDYAKQKKELREQFAKGEEYSRGEMASLKRYVKNKPKNKRGRPKKPTS